MLFNSALFIFAFTPAVILIFFSLGSLNYRSLAIGWLLIASLAFYSWDDPLKLLTIILVSIAFNFAVGWALMRRPSPWLLAVGIGGDLLLLGTFKYAGFLADTISVTTGFLVPSPNIALPIGISFFTFTQIAFLVDAYRGEVQEYKPLHYGLFVTFFPHLVAGPIYHHKEIMPQFKRREIYKPYLSNVTLGLTWIAFGLAKKVLLADPLSQYATPVFAAVAAGNPAGFVDSWIAAFSFALQLYFDFSGYSDMAIGLGLLIGVKLPINFNSPYKAISLIDFWRRWHISLSRFLRDYLYIPLGGSRRGHSRRYLNLLITMLLGGLWHGAAWTFAVWGLLHGLGLLGNHLWRSIVAARLFTLPKPLAWAFTFIFVVVAWVPFRADGIQATLGLWTSMAGFNGWLPEKSAVAGQIGMAVLWIGAMLTAATVGPNTQKVLSYPASMDIEQLRAPNLKIIGIAGFLFGAAVACIVTQRQTEFLYFRF